MQIYKTLVGSKVIMDHLTGWEYCLFSDVLATYEEFRDGAQVARQKQKVVKKWRAANFIVEARKLVHEHAEEPDDLHMAMRGNIGEIVRDCYYRLWGYEEGHNADEAAWERYVENIRHNPARLLLDTFLEGWPSQNQFATVVNIDTSTLSRLLSFALDPNAKSSSLITISRLRDVFLRLGVAPRWQMPQSPPPTAKRAEKESCGQRSDPLTVRELYLMKVTATAVKLLQEKNDPDAIKELLAFTLGFWSSVVDPRDLAKWTNEVFDNCITSEPAVITVDSLAEEESGGIILDQLFDMIICPQKTADKLPSLRLKKPRKEKPVSNFAAGLNTHWQGRIDLAALSTEVISKQGLL